jgi:lysozyme family protein
MTVEFSRVIPFLVKAEGELSNNKQDYGGTTKYGISQREYPKIDLDSLTLQKACEILERDYWKRYRIGEFREQTIANQLFLLIINMHPLYTGQILQRAVNNCKIIRPELKEDGVIGSQTITTVNSFSSYETLFLSANIRNEACRYYLKRVDDDTTQLVNLRSWIRRSLLC